MMHICPRSPNQQLDELPFEEEILAFLRNLGHSREIKKITDVNINKLHQPWRSFAVVINKCPSGKSIGYDSLRLSQAQILWGMYHNQNLDFAYLLWEDFMYQVKHKDVKKSNELYYPRFTKVTVNFFLTKDPSIPKRKKVNWHYARDDQMFTTIKLVSRHQNTQHFGAILPVELTNEDIRNSAAYKEYYAIASGAEPPKTKASVRKTQSISDTTMSPLVAKGTRLLTSTKVDKPAKGKQPANGSGTYEGTGLIPGVPDVPTYESDAEISWKLSDEDDDDDVQQSEHDEDIDDQSDDESLDDQEDDDDQDDEDDDQTDLDNDGDDFVNPKFSTHDVEAKDEESFDPIGGEGPDAEDDDNELYGDVNINLEGIDSLFESTPRVDVPVTTTVESLLLAAPTLPSPSIPIISQVQQALAPSPATTQSTSLQDLPNFSSLFRFDHRLKTLEDNFSAFMQTNQFDEAVSSIPGIVDRYLDHRMNEAIKVAVRTSRDCQGVLWWGKDNKELNEVGWWWQDSGRVWGQDTQVFGANWIVVPAACKFGGVKDWYQELKIIMENVPPPNNNPNVPEEEPILDQAPAALIGFVPQYEEEDPEEEHEKEEIEDEDMVNDKEDDAEVINPYEEADPHNRPPPTSDEETEFAPPVVQIADADDVPIPPVIQFGSNFHIGESSAIRDLLAGNSKVYAPGPMWRNLKSLHRGVMKLSKQMHDRYRTEKKMARKLRQDELRMNGQEFDIIASDSAVKENRSENSKMMKRITGLSREFTELKIQNRKAEELSRWEAWVRGRIPNNLRFQQEPSIYTAHVPHADDPYVMVKDAAMDTQGDEDIDTDAP
nr:hypothetical protein [Tanacetum cinerariifolium]